MKCTLSPGCPNPAHWMRWAGPERPCFIPCCEACFWRAITLVSPRTRQPVETPHNRARIAGYDIPREFLR